MGTVSAMLLSCLLAADKPAAAGVPLTDDELQIAVAALEEQRSRLRSFQVTYRFHQEVAPGVDSLGAKPAVGEYTTEWSWQSGREHLLRTSIGYREEWWYDGKKGYVWQFKRNDPSKLNIVSIYHWRPEQAVNYDMARIIGFGGPNLEGGLSMRATAALGDRTLSGEKSERGWRLEMLTQMFTDARYEITALLDPKHDFRLNSWTLRHEGWPEIQRFIVDQFQSVTDEGDASRIWYPLRAHMEQLVITRLDVDSIRINLDLPDSEFTPPEMPFGTEVDEHIHPGEMPKTYLVGGPDAEEARLSALVEVAKRMRDQQEREAVAVDATPDTASNPFPWFLSGALLLGLGGFLYWRRRRAA